jgi:F-type H+-transporting ATPase subunit c
MMPMLAAAADAVNTAAAAAPGLTGNVHVAAAALGAAIGVGIIGMKASEAVGRNPGAATKILVQAILSTAFAEGIVFFAIFLVK